MNKQVLIPATEHHEGFYAVRVVLDWKCPVCDGPRGTVSDVFSYDGSRRLEVNGWSNPCGHVDKYDAVRKEAAENGLNR